MDKLNSVAVVAQDLLDIFRADDRQAVRRDQSRRVEAAQRVDAAILGHRVAKGLAA
jgi:hypothetical protein